MSATAVSEKLRKGLRALGLSSLLEELERVIEDPAAKSWSMLEHLEHLVYCELAARDARAIERRIKAVQFPWIVRLEDYDFSRMPELDRDFIVELHGCDWIRRGDNVVYYGGTVSGRPTWRSRTAWRRASEGFECFSAGRTSWSWSFLRRRRSRGF